MRVYIAGALSSNENTTRSPSKVVTDYIQNLSYMCQVASEVRRMGHFPYVPCLDFLLGAIAGDWEENDYRDISTSFLEVCDAVLVLSLSNGVRGEIQRAKELSIPICYSHTELMRLQNP